MNAELQNLLADVYAAGQENDAQIEDRSRKMLNLEPETAQLLSIVARSSRRSRILEIGTSNGYSTLWLAWVAQLNNGRVVSVDRDVKKQVQADTNLRRAHLRELVDLMSGDASQVVAALPGPFDFVFFDADRLSAPAQLQLLLPKLTPDVFLLADNALSHPDEIAGYLAAVSALPDFEHIIVPVGKGLSIAYRHAV